MNYIMHDNKLMHDGESTHAHFYELDILDFELLSNCRRRIGINVTQPQFLCIFFTSEQKPLSIDKLGFQINH